MTFTPTLPLSGYAGWAFLKRTLTSQTSVFNTSAEIRNDEAYFKEKIGSISTADELVNDRRLLKVALGAFGLEADIDNKFFIKKVLSDGTLATSALASKLSNKQYQKMSAAFGFGDFPIPSTKISTFPDTILAAYKERRFEGAIGTQNSDYRFALNVERELPGIASKNTTENAKWYAVLGNGPLRQVFEKALGLPRSIGSLDLDQQLEAFKEKAKSQFGDSQISQFTDASKIEKLTRRYLLRSEAENYAQLDRNNVALQLLQQSRMRSRFF